MSRERYLRLQSVEGLAFERLARMRVAVVGAGAIGNEVVKNLVLMGVGSVDVHDFDRVEAHNLTRSIFLREGDIGRSKAACVAARAGEVDPNVRVRAVEGDAWRTLRLAGLAGCSALVAAVDQLEARMKLSQLARLAGVPFVNTAIDSRAVLVEILPYHAGDDVACYECHLPPGAYARIAERYSCGWLRRALFAEATVPTTTITASVAGALATQAVLRVGALDAAQRTMVDTRTGASSVVALHRNAECVGCAPLVPRPTRVPASGDWWRALRARLPNATAVVLSDALIFDYRCTACGDEPAGYVGRRADEFDDRIAACARCGELAVRIDVRTEATVDELRRLGVAPPVKFLLAAGDDATLCIDLEDR